LFLEFKAEDSQNCPAGQRLNSIPELSVKPPETGKSKKIVKNIRLIELTSLYLYQLKLINYHNMEKENLTPEESFVIINKAIANFKMNYRESSHVFLLWGWILTLASISNFIILKSMNSWEAWEHKGFLVLGNWVLFILIGSIIMYFIVRREKKEKKVYSQVDKFIDKLWWVTAPSFFIATFICIKLEIAPPPLMLLVAGIATTTTGLVIRFKPLIFGGISFFLFSIASTFVTNEYLALVVSAALICGYLIPGYLLKAAKE